MAAMNCAVLAPWSAAVPLVPPGGISWFSTKAFTSSSARRIASELFMRSMITAGKPLSGELSSGDDQNRHGLLRRRRLRRGKLVALDGVDDEQHGKDAEQRAEHPFDPARAQPLADAALQRRIE